MRIAILAFVLIAAAAAAHAGEADVAAVDSSRERPGTWRFDVTVAHADEGWGHYADRIEVVAPDGAVLATRNLAHPHVEEQPFTRSVLGVAIPEGVGSVTVRANDSVHGYGGAEIIVELPP